MILKVQCLVARTNLAVAVIFFLWGMFLVTMPLHPFASDSHAGLMAVFPGVLLLALALLTYLAGRLLRRLPGWGGLAEAAVPMFVIAVVLALALK